jgi:citrate lyase synthetase
MDGYQHVDKIDSIRLSGLIHKPTDPMDNLWDKKSSSLWLYHKGRVINLYRRCVSEMVKIADANMFINKHSTSL